MVQAIKEGLPASVSNTAGTLSRNHLMYQALYLVERRFPHVKGRFMHIPYMMEQGGESTDYSSYEFSGY